MKRHNRFLSVVLAGIVAFSMIPLSAGNVNADRVIASINGIDFPDEVLRQYVSRNFDKNKNGQLELAEAKLATSIYIRDNYLKTLNGIGNLRYLTRVSISSDNLQNVFQLTGLPGLKTLSLTGKKINTVNVKKNPELESITICGSEKLVGINLEENTKLKTVVFRNCPKLKNVRPDPRNASSITSLELNNTGVQNFDYNDSPSRNLDLSQYVGLETLNLTGAKGPTTINISKCTKLKNLYISNSSIKSLDLTKNKNLVNLSIDGSAITKFDVTNLSNIKWLLKNGKKTYDLTKSIASVSGKINGVKASFDYNAWKTTLVDGKKTVTPYPKGYVEPNKTQYAFVERMYTTCMKRASDPEGKEFWAQELATHRITGEYIGVFFFLSDEMVNMKLSDKEFVTRLYKTFMDREPEKGGFDFWCQYLKDGRSRSDVVYGFTRSAEFVNKCKQADIIPY